MGNGHTIAAMRRGGFLVNTARGEVVDEQAMKSAIRSGHLAGAALDVFAVEPLADPDLWSMPEVLLTPHVGANAVETTLTMAEAAARELADYFRL
jgi:D-3-phosphoglycerate dehydrogenase